MIHQETIPANNQSMIIEMHALERQLLITERKMHESETLFGTENKYVRDIFFREYILLRMRYDSLLSLLAFVYQNLMKEYIYDRE